MLMRLKALYEPTPWAMGVAHALKTIAHGVGSYKKRPSLSHNKTDSKSPLFLS
jgi:hypothetical protein